MPYLKVRYKTRVVTPEQLRAFNQAKNPEKKMDALEIPRGKRASIPIKKDVIARLWKSEHLIKRNQKFSITRKYIEALADHIAGETLIDAALKYGLPWEKLGRYKTRFMQVDSMLPQFIEGLFEHAAVSAIAIWNEKKESLSAKDAALSAGIFAEKAIMLRKARKTDYKDESISLATLQRLGSIIDKVNTMKQGEVIDVEADIKQIENVTSKD